MSANDTPAGARHKLAVYIGRFSPFHNGHREVLKFGEKNFDATVVLIGSADQSRRLRNPFTADERSLMMSRFSHPDTIFIKIRDYPYNDPLWEMQVQNKVNKTIDDLGWGKDETEVHLIGADRDETTKYLKSFPKYKTSLIDENREVSLHLSATAVRDIYLGQCWNGHELTIAEADVLMKSFIPPTTREFLSEFRKTEAYQNLVIEHQKMKLYKEGSKHSKYEPIFQTTDVVVIQSGYVLLVKRGGHPGKGQYALPGGFLEPKLKLFDNAIKELYEETNIKIPEKVMRGSYKHIADTFDDPNRSDRGRTITNAFLFVLENYEQNGKVMLPKVKGGDDADEKIGGKAFWMELAEVYRNPTLFFEDHFHIIETLVSRYKEQR